MIDVRRLKVLQAVVDTGSVAGAATLLNYTPSAVSQQMSTLERETGVRLLEHVGRGVRPTDAALLLCEHTTRVLGAIQDAEDALVALRAGHIGRLRLGSFPTASAALVPAALVGFQERHPNISLELITGEPDELMTALRGGSLDVAVTTLTNAPDEPSSDGLSYQHLLSDPFRVVLPSAHPLARQIDVDLASLASERWIGVSSCPNYYHHAVEDACERTGFRPLYALEADEYPTAQGFVAAGLGVALMPMLALESLVHPGVVVRLLRGTEPARQVWAVTRRDVADQTLTLSMITCLESAARALGAAAAI